MKINLGSSNQRIDGFFNIDHRAEKNVDIIDDAFELKNIKENSVEQIIASHILEHASFDRTNIILKRWNCILKQNGLLWIAVPNFDLVISEHLNNYKNKKITWEYFNSRIFGNASVAKKMYGEDYIKDIDGVYKYEMAYHKSVFNKEMLMDCLGQAGFINIQSIDRLPFPEKKNHPHEICCVGQKK